MRCRECDGIDLIIQEIEGKGRLVICLECAVNYLEPTTVAITGSEQ